ncbi:MAG: DUF4214 domain-containing protein [Halieaceae bacterium]|nr:DUF4214 domain-containing protein [Halieaceae bacterium]
MSRTVEFVPPTQRQLDNLLSDFRWSTGQESPARISYVFTEDANDYLFDVDLGYYPTLDAWNQPFRAGFTSLGEAHREAVTALFRQLERVINVEFVEVEDSGEAQLQFALTDLSPEQVNAIAHPPRPDLLPFGVDYREQHQASEISGDIWLHHELDTEQFLSTLPGAVGTALGLSSTALDGFAVSDDSEAESLPEALDYVRYTVMSGQSAPPGSEETGFSPGFAKLDLEALQYLYGSSADAGNDLYIIDRSISNPLPAENLGFDDSYTAHNFFNAYLGLADSGGRNVLIIDVEEDLEVNLNADSWSNTGGGASGDPNLYLDPSTQIQELITVDGDDRVTGNALSNRIEVRGGNDRVEGGSGNDTVLLGSGNDHYLYTIGADRADGGPGVDTIELGEQGIGRYKLVVSAGVLTISDIAEGGEARFVNFEKAELNGESASLGQIGGLIRQHNLAAGLFEEGVPLHSSSITGSAGEISPEQAQLYRMYYGSLGRAPDREGFDFWLDSILAETRTIEEVAEAFVKSPEFIGLADVNSSGNVGADEFVTHMYRNVFGRQPDQQGFNWWVGQLFSLEHTQASAFLHMVQSDEFVALTAATVADFVLL